MPTTGTGRTDMNRRQFLTVAGSAAALLGGGAAKLLAAEEGTGAGVTRGSGFRIAHLTDIHVQPELRADEGMRACLEAIHNLKPRPDLILTGGDLVFDILAVGDTRAKALFDLYIRLCKDSDIPIRQCVGNHDVFGWSSKGKIAPDHVSYGKKMVQERLDLPRTTYSFDHKGWHFCMIDDIQPTRGDGYEGGISEADLDWLDKDLAAAAGAPTLICAHIPILSVAVFRGQDATNAPHHQISKGLVCRNPKPILELMRKHHVPAVLTGHLHQNEYIKYDGTTYIGEGAVSGGWWKGAHLGNPEGYGVVDLHADGTFSHEYVTYGWKAKA